jgi:hypothetical protein
LISISGTFVYQPPQEAGEFFAAELGTFVIALVIVNDDGSAVLTADPINEQLTVVVVLGYPFSLADPFQPTLELTLIGGGAGGLGGYALLQGVLQGPPPADWMPAAILVELVTQGGTNAIITAAAPAVAETGMYLSGGADRPVTWAGIGLPGSGAVTHSHFHLESVSVDGT